MRRYTLGTALATISSWWSPPAPPGDDRRRNPLIRNRRGYGYVLQTAVGA